MTYGAFCARVMAHYRAHGRHTLPWRTTQDPYAILVSEIMLQQTQVDRVIPHFDRWMKKFPTPHALARAWLPDVLREWQGLGYNRRGKLLHDCAKEIIEQYSGKIPKDFAALVDLPGIGPYTAGAIRAFAFNEPEVFIETNIRAALIHHFFPRSKKVPDSKLTPILKKLLTRIPKKVSDARRGESVGRDVSSIRRDRQRGSATKQVDFFRDSGPREWYSALMDYGAHIKKTHPNPSRRSKHYTRQSSFEGSQRQVRGAIMRARTRGEPLQNVRVKYKSQFKEAYKSLRHDGLIDQK